MEYDLNQWRNNHSHHQFEHEQPSTKIQRLLLDEQGSSQQHIHQNGSSGGGSETALPLFVVPEPNRSISNSCSSNLSAFPDSLTTTTYRFPRIGGLFSLAQWQELELQALIFKYMLAGAAVPPELLHSIKKSFLNTPACCLHYTQQQQHFQHFQPALLQSGYWGRGSMDPEPGRCRRTDGKKWRCSRDVVPGQKYCERHVHRGRNRSRKPVEIPTPAPAGGGGQKMNNPVAATTAAASSNLSVMTSGINFSSPSMELLHINQRSSEKNKLGDGFFQETHNQRIPLNEKPDGQILRHFFDDWPRSNQESNGVGNNASPATSTTCLSISTPGNPSSDFSLKLSTGNVDEQESQEGNAGRDRPQMNWAMAWGGHQVSSMGGPLAEALRSSTTNSSPTSVLHELRRGSLSAETSSVST